MALFEKPSHQHILTLLRVGFAARLRSELADTYLSVNEKENATLYRTDNREFSTVFVFVSGDNSVLDTSDVLPRSALAAVLASKTSKLDDAYFLTLDNTPSLTDSPNLLKVSLTRAPHSRRLLFSLSTPGPEPVYLTLFGVQRDQPVLTSRTPSKHALFHFEIVPQSIGKGFASVSFPHSQPFFYPSQAFTHAILQLGVRFRLRSIHSSLLARRSSNSLPTGNSLFLSPNSDGTVPCDELVLSSALRTFNPHSADLTTSLYTLVDVDTNRSVHVSLPSVSGGRAASLTSSNEEMSTVFIRAADQAWGGISIGTACLDKHKNENENSPLLWLMGGRNGSLDLRRHRRAWEMFTVEFVAQSFTATIRELPISAVYFTAEKATRADVRAAIEKRVATATATAVTATGSKNGGSMPSKKSGGFNHAAALAALSDENSANRHAIRSDNMQEKETAPQPKKPQISQKGREPGRAVAGSAAAAPSSLPRNAANRKTAKKNRKKKNAAARKQNASFQKKTSGTMSRDGSSSSSRSGQSPADRESSSQTTPQSSEESRSSKASSANSSFVASGPPCAACGRPLAEAYTTAMGKNFHSHCFCCGMCRRPMGVSGGQFRERGGVPYCQSCYASHIAARCARCSQPILETVVTAMEKTWHKNCLTCVICRLPVTETFWLYADKPNEPRCSRCVTGEEHTTIRRPGRMNVNMLGVGPSNTGTTFNMNTRSAAAGSMQPSTFPNLPIR